MTVQELCAKEGVNLCYFDGSNWHSPGFFNPALNVLALDFNLSVEDQKQVALHELGHKEHTPVQYELNRELCELQADRSMIHHLLEEELKLMDDVRDFNYLHFMEKYSLKTIEDLMKKSKPFYKKAWFIIFIILVVIGGISSLTKPKSKTTSSAEKSATIKNNTFKMTDKLGEEFAVYLRKNAEVLDRGNKIEFITGGNTSIVSVRVGEAWKYESVSRKIYLSNSFLKQKNELFKKWAKENNYEINPEKDSPELIVIVSDADKTIIAEEYNGEMKILNN